MDTEAQNHTPVNARAGWPPEPWPAEAEDACAPEGGVPARVHIQMSVAEQWAYAAEASS